MITVRVHIGTLAVSGGRIDRRALQRAVERELGVLLAEAPPAQGRPYAAAVRAPAGVSPRAGVDRLGAELAVAVHGVLTA
jgi:hypothetical protein